MTPALLKRRKSIKDSATFNNHYKKTNNLSPTAARSSREI